ncbi:MAG: metallophosphoesterase [Pseudobdellovibrio sp.]
MLLKKILSKFGIFSLIVLLISIWSFLIEPSLLKEQRIESSKWKGSSIRIVFFSDLHAGAPHINEKYISDLVLRINLLKPDVILIGGDLVINGVIGGSPIAINKIGEMLSKLEARLGVFAVLGNHDWWNDSASIIKSLKSAGIIILENKSVVLDHKGYKFSVVGVGDAYTNHADFKLAIKEVPEGQQVVLFMHDPSVLLEIRQKFYFAFAGHMHGGQIFIPGYGAIITPGDAPKDWADGWVNSEFGKIYVSKGIGTSIVPVRLNALPEYVVLDLTS